MPSSAWLLKLRVQELTDEGNRAPVSAFPRWPSGRRATPHFFYTLAGELDRLRAEGRMTRPIVWATYRVIEYAKPSRGAAG
jgi:hypothetical protein